jgi:nudix-type nucleoside diphosphatase (YffH/AdpP family)
VVFHHDPEFRVNTLFLHAPFAETDLLARILGGPLPAVRPATLGGHVLRSDPSGLRVAPVASQGGSVPGALIETSPGSRARVGFLMAALGARAAPVRLDTGGRAIATVAYVFAHDTAPTTAWDGVEAGEPAARLRETVEEVMGHFGRRAPEEMPALLNGIGIRALGRARGLAQPMPEPGLSAGFGRADVLPAARAFVYARYFGVEEHRLSHRRFDGAMSPPLDRAVFTSGDAVTVLPFDPRRDEVLLIEQFRAGVFARHDPHPWCLEAVAGRCDRSEAPELTARREAREEAGLELGRLEQIVGYYPSPGTMSEFITAFVGEADLSQAGGTHGLDEEHEDIRVIVVPLERAVAAALSGEINNAPLILSVLWLERNAARLRSLWGGYTTSD